MKALVLLPVLLAGCSTPAVVNMRAPDGSSMMIASSARLGGKGGTMVRNGQFAFLQYDNNENSMRDVASAYAWGSFWKAAGGAAQSLFDSNKDVDLANAQVSALGVEAGVEKLKITTEAATAIATTPTP